MGREKSRWDFIEFGKPKVRSSKKKPPAPSILPRQTEEDGEPDSGHNGYAAEEDLFAETEQNPRAIGWRESFAWLRQGFRLPRGRISPLQIGMLVLLIPVVVILGIITCRTVGFLLTPTGQIVSVLATFGLFLLFRKQMFS